MSTDRERLVKSAMRISNAVSRLLRIGPQDDANHVQFKFAGLDARSAADELRRQATGHVFILPDFRVVDGKPRLSGVLVVDGLSEIGRASIVECDLVGLPSSLFGLLTRTEDKCEAYICAFGKQALILTMQRPPQAEDWIRAGSRALSVQLRKVRSMAA